MPVNKYTVSRREIYWINKYTADVKFIGCYEDKGERAMQHNADKKYTLQMCKDKCLWPHSTRIELHFYILKIMN